jgi:TolB protein
MRTSSHLRAAARLLAATFMLFGTVAPALAAYPGGNGRIAFELEDQDGFTHLWWANPDRSDPEQLTFGSYSTWDPAWSADGRMLVFSTDRYATAPASEPGFRVDIVTVDVATGQQNLVEAGGIINEQPSFSPDGSRILFYGCFSDCNPSLHIEPGLYTVRTSDGGDLQHVTGVPQDAEYLQAPRYSPDGTRIAFSARKEASSRQQGAAPREGAVYIVNADGSGLRRLTPWGDLLNGGADWSPDGSQLVMQTDWRRGTRPSLWIMNADGSNLRRLTEENPIGNGLPFQASFAPTWAPDGTVIMFICAPGEASFWDVCTIRPDGTGRTVVASTPEDEHRPVWQPLP